MMGVLGLCDFTVPPPCEQITLVHPPFLLLIVLKENKLQNNHEKREQKKKKGNVAFENVLNDDSQRAQLVDMCFVVCEAMYPCSLNNCVVNTCKRAGAGSTPPFSYQEEMQSSET